MITYFPKIYPDELLYSQLARCHVKSGYQAYAYMAEDFFLQKTATPDIEFVNEYTPTALRIITKDISMKDIIMKHTMFPYYGRFLPSERKQKAFDSLYNRT